MSDDDTYFSGMDYADIQGSVEAQLGPTPQGWSGLVTKLFEEIKNRCDERSLVYPQVVKIKEKFGELRIYCRDQNDDEYIAAWIAGTIIEANRTCEKCGNAALVQNIDGYYATLCVWCAHEVATQRHPDRKRLLGDRKRKRAGPNFCTVCCYEGQIDRSDDRGRCPACVKKGW